MDVPEEYHDLFESKSFAHVATILPDGSPHSVPMWVGYDGEYVLTAGGQEHQRHANMQRDRRVALSIVDPDDPYRSISIRGEVVEMAEDGALAFLDEKARLHWDVDEFPHERDKDRYLVKIEPRSVVDSSSG